jgi:uncharacterized protein
LTPAADLTSLSKADLAKAAKSLKISGTASMSKEQLIAALTRASSDKAAETATATSVRTPKTAQRQSKPNNKSAAGPKAGKSTSKSQEAKAADAKTSPAKKTTSKGTAKSSPKPPAKATKSSKPAKIGSVPAPRSSAKKPAKPQKTESAAVPAKTYAKPKTAKRSAAVGSKLTAAAPSTTKPKSKAQDKKDKKTGKQTTKTVATLTSPKVLKKIRELQLQREAGKDIAFRPTLVRPPGASEPIWEKEPQKDRIGLFVRDPYWLHASWDITRNAVDRARAALAEQWHTCKPILRLLRLDDSSTSSPAETVERDIDIHGGLRNWYIPWTGAATNFRVLVGYLSGSGRFHAIAKSNIVKTTAAGAPDSVDQHWSDVGAESERIFALSGGYDSEHETDELREILEDRVHRSLGAPALAKLGVGTEAGFRRRNDFYFDMDVELVIYGATLPDGFLTLNGEPVTLRTDGSFAVRLPFPDRRQVLPAVACTRDGSQQRTIVVAVERNTKIMEPMEQERDTGD